MIHRVLVESQSGGKRTTKEVHSTGEASKQEGARIARNLRTLLKWKLEARPSKPVIVVAVTSGHHHPSIRPGLVFPSTKDFAAALETSDTTIRVLLCRAKKAGELACLRGVEFRYAFQ